MLSGSTHRISALIAAFWCGIAAASPEPERQEELVFLLKQDCGSCHGMRLKGGLGPALLPQALSTTNHNTIKQIILNGRPGLGMPAWKGLLSDQDAAWLAKILIEGLNGSD